MAHGQRLMFFLLLGKDASNIFCFFTLLNCSSWQISLCQISYHRGGATFQCGGVEICHQILDKKLWKSIAGSALTPFF